MRQILKMKHSHYLIFQSTHPLRDATEHLAEFCQCSKTFQSTHPLRDATLGMELCRGYCRFQSTHPLRDATGTSHGRVFMDNNFNPRTPYGMRHLCPQLLLLQLDFNPRTPYGMRRFRLISLYSISGISIHAPLTGCDILAIHFVTFV